MQTTENIAMANDSNHFNPKALNVLKQLLSNNSKDECIDTLQSMFLQVVSNEEITTKHLSEVTVFYHGLLNFFIHA